MGNAPSYPRLSPSAGAPNSMRPGAEVNDRSWCADPRRPTIVSVPSDRAERSERLLRRYEKGERDFRGIRLGNVNLVGAALHDADLSGADLKGATLVHSDLRNAKFVGADLAGTILAMADLRGADLRDAFLASTDLRLATYNLATRFPDDFDPASAGLVPQSGVVLHAGTVDAADVLRANAQRRRAGNR